MFENVVFCFKCGKPMPKDECNIVVPVDEKGNQMDGHPLCDACLLSFLLYALMREITHEQ